MSLNHARQNNVQSQAVVVLGEVLFDHFPGGKKVLGGAPFNVAWNLKGLGLEPYFVSSVGKDSEGDAVLKSMKDWGLRTEGVYTSPDRSTGRVVVTMEDSEPSYEIPLDQAFDNLELAEFDASVVESFSQATLIYHGSLFFRTPANQKFFKKLLAEVNLPRFVDLNIREPWFEESWVQALVRDAKWVKLNIHELNQLADSDADPAEQQSIESAIQKFKTKEKLSDDQIFLVTCGEQGAYWIDDDKTCFAPSTKIDSFVDSVGAGDAFSSAAIAGIVNSASPDSILNSAVRFAASVCERNGATSNEIENYTRHVVSTSPSGD